MLIIDIVCVLLIAGFALLGFKNGGLYELIQLGMLVGAIVVTSLVHPIVSKFVFKVLQYSITMENLIYFCMLAVILFIAFTFLTRFIKTLVSFKEPGTVNRAAGGVFAAVKGFGYVGIALILVALFVPDSTIAAQIKEGKVSNFIEGTMSKTTRTVDSKVKKSNVDLPNFN